MSTRVAEKGRTKAARPGRGAKAAGAGEGDARFAQVFAALGEPTRLRIMQILPRQPICHQMYNVVELAEELGLKQPTVSHHLKILADAGLLLCRRDCNSLYFYVNQPAVKGWLCEIKCRFGCEE